MCTNKQLVGRRRAKKNQTKLFTYTILENYILKKDYSAAFFTFDEYLNADFYPYASFYFNATGLDNYFNFLTPVYHTNPYIEFLNLNTTRNSIHVGDNRYHDYNSTVEEYLIPDWMKSIRYKLPPLLENYKVLVYNGQNDIILGGPVCENFLRGLVWSGQNEFLAAQKIIWKVETTDQQVNNISLHFKTTHKRFTNRLLAMSAKPENSCKQSFVMQVTFFLLINHARR